MVRGGGRQSWRSGVFGGRPVARTAGVAVPPQLSRAAFAVEVTDVRPAETIDRTRAKPGVAADNKPHVVARWPRPFGDGSPEISPEWDDPRSRAWSYAGRRSLRTGLR